jgi:hypothetical protein
MAWLNVSVFIRFTETKQHLVQGLIESERLQSLGAARPSETAVAYSRYNAKTVPCCVYLPYRNDTRQLGYTIDAAEDTE